jgi:hypothetical protein
VRYEGPTGIIATLEYTDANLLFRSIFAGAKGCIFAPFLHPLDAGLWPALVSVIIFSIPGRTI